MPDHARYRIGLSATPEHYLDEERNERLAEFYGETVFRHTLRQIQPLAGQPLGQLLLWNLFRGLQPAARHTETGMAAQHMDQQGPLIHRCALIDAAHHLRIQRSKTLMALCQ